MDCSAMSLMGCISWHIRDDLMIDRKIDFDVHHASLLVFISVGFLFALSATATAICRA